MALTIAILHPGQTTRGVPGECGSREKELSGGRGRCQLVRSSPSMASDISLAAGTDTHPAWHHRTIMQAKLYMY